MTKRVVSILPQGHTDVIEVEDDIKRLTITMVMEKGGSAVLEVPIETMEVDGVTRHFTRYSSGVQDEVVLEALSKK